MPTLRFTKRAIDALPYPTKGQVLYRDEMLRGFGLRVGSKSKVFFAEGQVQNRTRRVTIGRADVLGVDSARKRALGALSDMAAGIDPNAEKRRALQENVTLGQAFDNFFSTRSTLAASTRDRYHRCVNLYLKDWKQQAITSLSRQMILKRHQRIGKQHGEVTANNVMRALRSVYNVTAASH
ncbi:MAG: Arm DNA-binding domain-containing protein, partial [Pseudomonadota bacterium]|nr:Arm DNA-binding domain-containing protein [Pseudomonadota bacterium]